MTTARTPETGGIRASVAILDVGHGNATIIRDEDAVAVVDAPPGETLPDELLRTHTARVEHLVLSHADRDHLGGAVALLSHDTISIGRLWFNPDAQKTSDTWQDLRTLAFNRHELGTLDVSTDLNAGHGAIVLSDGVDLQIIHPDIGLAGTGPRPSTHPEGRLDANTFSAVVRVVVGGVPTALVAGDVDRSGLDRILARGVDIRADLLVFPHHGGSPRSGDDRAFARDLVAAVGPTTVVFSLGRHRWRNPLPEIVAGVRDAAPHARIACTQLSKRCAADPGPYDTGHLGPTVAAGRSGGICCAGSTLFERHEEALVDARADAHATFIQATVPMPHCRITTWDQVLQRTLPDGS
ncbi:MAG: competence protein ComEC [Frankiaceae bacterium]|nr:competence protein ComEC [Frankiaceae bacterium]